jgi:predicted transcriptional regulator
MILKLVKEMTGEEFIRLLEKEYRSLDNLKRLIERDPENALYQLDLDDWKYHLEHPDEIVKQSQTLFVKDLKIELSDLELLDVIRKEHPNSIRALAKAINKDYKTVQPKIHKLAEGGLVKFEEGPKKNMKKPVVNYNKIEIEV